MAEKYKSLKSYGNKRHNRPMNRQNYKIDSILRLSKALNRDVNKITGKSDNDSQIEHLDNETKLDIISNTLLEIRDKLENYGKSIPNSTQNPIQPQITPFNPMTTQLPYNYPYIPRIMF